MTMDDKNEDGGAADAASEFAAEKTHADEGPPGHEAEVIDMAEARAEAEAEAAAHDVVEDTNPGIPPEVIEAVVEAGAGAGAEADGDAGAGAGAATGDEAGEEDDAGTVAFEQLEALIEALLYAADKPLSMNDIKRLSGERDSRLINEALEALAARRASTGIQLVGVAGGYSLRTNPAFGPWVGKLMAGKPVRLSRAMMETMAIVAYRQPITRPEMDDIRGVDCGPVLKTLLDRGLVRIIGKKEEVGRPILYGTTPEFLRIFSLKDLTQLPTLRQFHELSAEHQAKVDAEHGGGEGPSAEEQAAATAPLVSSALAAEPAEDDAMLADLERASEAAGRAAGPLNPDGEQPGS
jgi:segregation and condensation protein B